MHKCCSNCFYIDTCQHKTQGIYASCGPIESYSQWEAQKDGLTYKEQKEKQARYKQYIEYKKLEFEFSSFNTERR